jgi:hypothetical protein
MDSALVTIGVKTNIKGQVLQVKLRKQLIMSEPFYSIFQKNSVGSDFDYTIKVPGTVTSAVFGNDDVQIWPIVSPESVSLPNTDSVVGMICATFSRGEDYKGPDYDLIQYVSNEGRIGGYSSPAPLDASGTFWGILYQATGDRVNLGIAYETASASLRNELTARAQAWLASVKKFFPHEKHLVCSRSVDKGVESFEDTAKEIGLEALKAHGYDWKKYELVSGPTYSPDETRYMMRFKIPNTFDSDVDITVDSNTGKVVSFESHGA